MILKFMVVLWWALALLASSSGLAAGEPVSATDARDDADLMTPSPAAELIKRDSSGDIVVRIQTRLLDLDYFHFKSTGSYGTLTHAAVMKFQEYNQVMADGTVGRETRTLLFTNAATRNPIPDEVTIPIGPAASRQPEEYGRLGDWFTVIRQSMKLRFPYMVEDLNTGTQFNVTRTGGENHAHVVPTTMIDAAKFLEIMGSEPNWNKRAVIVTIDDVKYAASLQCQPHGENALPDSNIDGILCLYFENSLSEVLDFKDEEHQRHIQRAAGNG